jgi:iron complex transport system substrate-binding protein
MKKRILALILAFAIALGLMASCAAEEPQTAPTSTPEAAPSMETPEQETSNQETLEQETVYPITVAHAFGETIIESKPTRIATISWGNHDVPLALGVVPVGFSEANYGVLDGSGILPWTAEKLAELGEAQSFSPTVTDMTLKL